MAPASLQDQASAFAADLTAIAQATFGAEVSFGTIQRPTGAITIGPVEGDKVGKFIPLVRPGDDAEQPCLWLTVNYSVSLDDEATYLMVRSSTFGLWVNVMASKPRPVFRVEYDRDAASKPQAHVHFHAESAELGWVYGSGGASLPVHHKIHFPVGGVRFRPVLEDVVLFLDDEKLFTNWASPDWRSVVLASRDAWEARQARATVRRFPQAAREVLAKMDAASPEL